MKYLFIFLIIPFISASECGEKKKQKEEEVKTGTKTNVETDLPGKQTTSTGMPACLKKMVDSLSKDPVDIPMKVDEYKYEGKTYFLLTAACCDQFNTLFDSNCNAVCAPTGGFTGRGDGKCPEFSKTAEHVKEVWKRADMK